MKTMIQENLSWDDLTIGERKMVLEIHGLLYPDKKLNESKWYNTLGDIVGIVDPTGIVDMANAVSYFRQGDKLFGFLSLVSAVPYAGDAVAKPVILLLKAGGAAAKTMRGATTSAKVAQAGFKIPVFGALLASMGKIGPKLMEIVREGKNIKIVGGFFRVIEQWVELFTKGAKEYGALKAGKTAGMAAKVIALTGREKIGLLKVLRQLLSPKGTKAFRSYKNMNPTFWSRAAGGMPRIWGNRSVRSLMVRTKWYLGLLNHMGIANFTGADELERKYGNKLYSTMEEYSRTPEAIRAWDGEFAGGEEVTEPQIPEPEGKFVKPADNAWGNDILGMILNDIMPV